MKFLRSKDQTKTLYPLCFDCWEILKKLESQFKEIHYRGAAARLARSILDLGAIKTEGVEFEYDRWKGTEYSYNDYYSACDFARRLFDVFPDLDVYSS